VTAAYLFVFPYFPAINSPNENVRLWTTRAIVTHGTFRIDEVEAAWGEVGDRAAVGGHHYSSKAPGTSLLGVPVHFVHDRLAQWIGGGPPSHRATTWVLRVFTVILPLAAFFCYFAGRVESETGSPWARDLLVVGLGLGTMLYPYGLTFVGHAQSAALLLTGFLLLTAHQGAPSARRLALAGALVALSVVFEYQALFGAALVAAYAALTHRRRALPFVLGALGPAILLGAYHTALFGRPWELPYAHLEDTEFQQFHHARGFLGLGQPSVRKLRAALFAPDFGLLVFSPFLAAGVLAALVGVVRSGSRKQAVVLAVTAAMLVFLAGMTNYRGGWSAGGPRYIAVVPPFLAWGIALGWNDLFARRWWAGGVLAGLVLASVVLCGLSGAVYPHFPEDFNNPIFDLVLRLVRDGFAPYGLGALLGLHGAASLLPVAIAIAGALVLALAAPRRRALTLAVAALAAAACLVPLSLYGRRYNGVEERMVRAVESKWEPRPEGPHGAP
jgi:hypothetical protein